jgi:atrial natriuretic peptide receptor A
LIAVLCCLCLIFFIVGAWGYNHFQREAEKSLWNWKINPNDIIFGKSSDQVKLTDKVIRSGSVSSIEDDLISQAGDQQQCYIPIGFFKGNRVAIKKIDTTGINLNRALMLELKTMKNLSHDHLVKFYGAAVEDPDLNCILTE